MTIQANQGFGVSIFGATSAGGGGSTSPGGSSGQLQYNASGSFGGMAGTSWDDTNRALTLTGATVTTSSPVLNLTQTWNDGAGGTVTFTGLKFNATDTASASGSLLLDLQVGGASKASITKAGAFYGAPQAYNTALFGTSSTVGWSVLSSNYTGYYVSNGSVGISVSSVETMLKSTAALSWSSGEPGANGSDTILRRAAAATLQLGAADAAAPVAQTFKVQGVVAGTTNTAGANFTIQGSQGTGTGAGGSIIFQVAPAGSSGTAQNAYSTALTIDSTRLATFAGNVIVPNAATLSNVAGNAFVYFGSGDLRLYTNSTNSQFAYFNSPSQLLLGANTRLAWNNAADAGTNSADTILARDAANTLALRNGGTSGTPVPQTFNIYNYWASASNYECLSLFFNSNIATIFVDKAGSGSNRDLALQGYGSIRLLPGNVDVVSISSTTMSIFDGKNIAFDTTTGTKIGTATSQKIGFWNATPAVQPTAVADATNATDVITQLNALLSRMRTIGVIAT